MTNNDINNINQSKDVEQQGQQENEIEFVEKIRNYKHVLKAIQLTFKRNKKHLLITWIQVPIGVMIILLVCWGFRLLINLAPFRFPAPVIAMISFFIILLILDFLSIKFPNKKKDQQDERNQEKRFIDPIMKLFAPPCEFLLRNMSVMFTPSFILIPAREVIPQKEIGLLTAWFIITQILGFLFPVGLNLGIEKVFKIFKIGKYNQRLIEENFKEKTFLPTLNGLEFEKGKGFNSNSSSTLKPLNSIATGLSGITANVIAPISHLHYKNFNLDKDAKRQFESTAIESARQQGDPFVSNLKRTFSYNHDDDNFNQSFQNHIKKRPPLRSKTFHGPIPKSDVSTFDHHHHGHHHHNHHRRITSSTSRNRSKSSRREIHSILSNGSKIHQNLKRTKSSPGEIESISSIDDNLQHKSLNSFLISNFNNQDHISKSGEETVVGSRRPSKNDFKEKQQDDGVKVYQRDHIENYNENRQENQEENQEENENQETNQNDNEDDEEEEEEDAITRLSSWIEDLITPIIYLMVLIIGLPLFFILEIALPLFLSINILSFIFSITIVPPKIRRFAHPILTTSLLTVLIIWSFAAMKGIGLKNCLNEFYSVNAKYSVLWNPNGYNGPIPGAGDILFSTLDAGIVALAIPMYRYRKELWENLSRMLIVLFPCASLSLFFWNFIAHKMTMDATRSLAFSARFMSTPLAIELANNVGADESITVILVVITGVVAAILKDFFFFKFLKINKEDFLTVGLTMGSTSGAIGANSLISTPKTMAIASLSFVLFGTILLICTAIPSIVDIMQKLSGSTL